MRHNSVVERYLRYLGIRKHISEYIGFLHIIQNIHMLFYFQKIISRIHVHRTIVKCFIFSHDWKPLSSIVKSRIIVYNHTESVNTLFTCSMPYPCKLSGSFSLTQPLSSRYFACSLLKSGYFSNKSARQPLTMGVAMDVPLFAV